MPVFIPILKAMTQHNEEVKGYDTYGIIFILECTVIVWWSIVAGKTFRKLIKHPFYLRNKIQMPQLKLLHLAKIYSNTLFATSAQVDVAKFCIMFP